MIEALLGNKAKERILLFLYVYREGYAREIAKTFNCGLDPIQKQIKRLETGGIISGKLKGKVRIFVFNPRYPFLKELNALLEKALQFIPKAEKERYYTPRLRPRRSGKPL